MSTQQFSAESITMDQAEAPETRCFVIGPIGNKFAPMGSPGRESYEQALEVFEKVIQPACQSQGVEPIRADHIAVSGEITEQVFRHLYEDEVVIADLSGANPNVMYELGLRHTRPLLTIQIGEYGQLPFDVTAVRTIQFSRSERGLIDARKALGRALAAGLSEGLEGVTATRIWLDGSSTKSAEVEATRDQLVDNVAGSAEASEIDEAGLYDRLEALESRFPVLTHISEDIGQILERLGAVAVDSTHELEMAGSSGATAKARLAIITRFAQGLQGPADELTGRVKDFADHMSAMDGEVQGILAFIEEHANRLSTDDTLEFLTSISDTAKASREAMEGLGQMGSSVADVEGFSRSVRRPARQIREAIKTMAKAASAMDDWDAAASRLRKQLRGVGPGDADRSSGGVS